MNPNTMKKVSVLVTSYNYGRYIGHTIKSVLSQTFEDFELVVVDDASSDNSIEVINSFSDPRLRVVAFKENRGAFAAYKHGLTVLNGEWLVSLDSDDYADPQRLEKQVAYLKTHPDIDVLGGWISEIDGTGNHVPPENAKSSPWFNVDFEINDPLSWVWQNRLNHSSAIVRREIHDQAFGLTSGLTYAPDYELWLALLSLGAKFDVMQERLTYYRVHGDNITFRNPQTALLETAYIQGKWLRPLLSQTGQEVRILEPLVNNSAFLAASPLLQHMVLALLSSERDSEFFHDGFENVKALLEKALEPKPSDAALTSILETSARLAITQLRRSISLERESTEFKQLLNKIDPRFARIEALRSCPLTGLLKRFYHVLARATRNRIKQS